MVFDAEKLRPAVEHVTRLANDFGFANMLFIKNCSLHLRDIPRPPATGIHSGRTWREPLALHSDPVVSFETEELVHCRGRDPVSAYPLIGLTFKIDCSYIPKIFHTISETLPEPLKFHAPLLKRFTGLLCIIVQFHRNVLQHLPLIPQVVMQVEFYDLTSSERVKRGVKRAWLIEETLALETGSGQKQPLNIHRTKYRGVRHRPSRSRTKPWTAELKPQGEENKVWIDDCDTPEAAAHTYDVAAFYYGKGNKALNFQHTPRFLPKTLEYSCEKEKKRAIQEQARHLRRNPLFNLIYKLPYDVLLMFVMWELPRVQGQLNVMMAWMVVKLVTLIRKDSSVIAVPQWLSAHLHALRSIPQLLESIDCLIKEIPQQKPGYDNTMRPYQKNFSTMVLKFLLPPLEAQDPTKVIPLTFQIIEWVRINLVTPREIDLRAPQTPTYQDATPEEQVVQSLIVEQSARILLSTPVAAIGETPLLPSPPPDVEIPNEGFQTGDLYEDIQEGSMSGERTSTSQTLSNFHHLPFSCFSPLSTGAQTQSSTFMDSDVAKDLMMPIPSSMEVGDCHPKCNNLVVPLAPSHEYTQDPPKQDLRNLDKLPLECEHLAFQVTSPEEDECIKSPTVVQATTEFMDLDDGEDLATLLERLPHHQLGDIGDQVASVEATLMEGCNPDINDMVLTSVPGDIEGNELNSLCGYEHVMEPPHPFAFSQQPFVQFDEYL
ncbi:unnamed protein product [Sphagnum troendelagicum]|uniref:AP2/ERF domain-containing protein n=1 Tax=Sphagnum troendelagicum TaxID=128251 RepID=A0ABP0TRH5_9BRYO